MRSSALQFYPLLLLILSTFTAAWPVWPRWFPDLDTLVVRQNTNSQTTGGNSQSSNSVTASPTNTPTGNSVSTTGSQTGGSSKTASTTGSVTGSATKSGSNSTKTHSTSYDARLPAGGVSMETPAVSDGAQYYKIGDYVTFAWNYTSLLATPTAVNIMATCTVNEQLYTIAMNQTVSNTAVTWDTGSYQATAVQDPLLTETYTLLIYDAASSISATAQAGYLAVYDTYTFGMYTPQPYVPLSEFVCVTCSGALSDMERAALKMVVGMSILTFLSFTWFVTGTGVIW